MKIFVKEDKKIEEIQVDILCQKRDQEVEGLIKRIENKLSKISGYKEGKSYLIAPKDIFYIDTVDNKLFLYLKSEVLEGKYKLYEIEELLADRYFIRCNKSTVINVTRIEMILPRENRSLLAVMENGEQIYISRNYAKKIKELIGG